MRLIDADALIQKLYEMKAKEEQYIGLENDVSVTIGSIGFEVMNIPTAYDIDKVVEEITKLRNDAYSYAFKYNDEFYDGQSDGLEKALDIINKHFKEKI